MPDRHPAEQYVADVLAGRIVAGKWTKLACERHRRDKRTGKARGLRFDRAAAERVIEFFHRFLKHSQGEWAGKPLILEPWQQFILWNVFGWKRPDGTRRFRFAYEEIARKNGKTTKLAGLGLYMLDADGEPGAQVYTAATKRDQAIIMHRESINMVNQSRELAEVIQVFKNNLSVSTTASKFEPLGADSKTLDGLNIHCALIDELHAHPNGDLYNILRTATGARRQPLVFAITTAGSDRTSFCGEQHDYAEKVLSGVIEDDAFFAVIYSLDEDDDWRDPAVWKKANPNLGVIIKHDELAHEIQVAQDKPSDQNAIRRLRLNEWTRADTRFLDLQRWDDCAGDLMPAELEKQNEGRLMYGGLDLASTTDVAAFVGVFPPEEEDGFYDVLCRFWIPEDSIEERVRTHRVPYDAWVRDGWVIATEGNVIDYREIREEILRLRDRYQIAQIGYDPWGSQGMANDLDDEGVDCVKVIQNFTNLSGPTKDLERFVLSKMLRHGGHPVLRWMADNLEVRQDPSGNAVRPIKPQNRMSHKKIDGMVALIEAIDRTMRNESTEPAESVYEGRGVILV